MTAKTEIDHARLRELVEEGRTDEQIAEELQTSSRTIRRARAELGLTKAEGRPAKGRTAGLHLKVSEGDRETLHKLAEVAGYPSTTEWLLELPALSERARVARDASLPPVQRKTAMDAILRWLGQPPAVE